MSRWLFGCGFAPAGNCYDPVSTALIVTATAAAASAGYSGYQSKEAGKKAKVAAEDEKQRQLTLASEARAAESTAQQQAKNIMTEKRRRLANVSKTIYNPGGPLGIAGMATTARKTLLGQ